MEFDLSQVKLSNNDIKRGLVLPKNPSVELSEFIGILAGDGHISFNKRSNKIIITGNSKTDYSYLSYYIKNLILKLFNIHATFSKRNNMNAVIIYLYSQGLVTFMKQMGYYKHKIQINIPNWIMINDKYMSQFIKGLIDTDGCVFVSDKVRSPQYPCIELTTICLRLAKDVKNFLEKKKFRVAGVRSYYYAHSNNASYKVSLYGQQNLSKWIKEIGFSNEYKLNKAIRYKDKIRSGAGGKFQSEDNLTPFLNPRQLRLQRSLRSS